MKKLLAVAAVLALAACSTPTSPASLKAPTSAAQSRYMLASGVWICDGSPCADQEPQ